MDIHGCDFTKVAATKQLMIQYYRALRQGEEGSNGLRQMQLRMLRSARWWHL
jgi:CHAT domain-containing protein